MDFRDSREEHEFRLEFRRWLAEHAPRDHVGTALTLQTSLGFLLTAASVQLVPQLAEPLGWAWSFPVLAVGPLLGIGAIARLRRAPSPSTPPPAAVPM